MTAVSFIPCEECGKVGGVMVREKLDPRNLQAERRRLCRECGETLGFRPPAYARRGAAAIPGGHH